MRVWLAFLMIVLIGCSSQVTVRPLTNDAPQPQEAPPIPAGTITGDVVMPSAPVQAPVAMPSDTKAVGNAAATIFGDAYKSPDALKIDDVICNKEKKAIMFSIRNNDDQGRKWQLNNDVKWGDQTTIGVHVLINSYEVNSRSPYVVDGLRYFGPNEKFSDNCGGVEVLNPGQTVTCTVYPVPLKESNVINQGLNEIFVKTYTSNHIIQFLCN